MPNYTKILAAAVSDWHTHADHVAMLIGGSGLVYLFLAGFTYDRSPPSWKSPYPGDFNTRIFAAIFWPVVWIGWFVYRVTMAYPHYCRWKRSRAADRLAKARVVRS